MAEYTVLNKEEIEEIGVIFGVNNIASHKVLSGGSENTNYLVVAKKGKFVLTICEQKTEQEASELAELLKYLETNNFSTSQVVPTKEGKFITLWNEKPVMLKVFLEGKVIENFSLKLMTFIGQELGKLHQIKSPDYIPKALSYGMENFKIIEEYAANSSFHFWLKKIQKELQEKNLSTLPKSLIHSDIFCNNIIVNEEETEGIIMDFEEATYYYRIYDLGMMIVGTCCQNSEVNLVKVGHLLKGYQKEIQLSEEEIKSLKLFTVYAAAATAFWRHKQYHYVHPDISMQNHYLAMKNLGDEIGAIEEEGFLNIF